MLNKNDKGVTALVPVPDSSAGFQKIKKHVSIAPRPPTAKFEPRAAIEMCEDIHLTNPEYDRVVDPENTLKKLIDSNQKYLFEKVKVSDVPTPPKYSHRIPSKTGQTEYFRKFGVKQRGKSVPEPRSLLQRADNLFNATGFPISGYQSTYQMEFHKKRPECALMKSQKKMNYQRPEAPSFNETSYQRDYAAVVASPTASAKRSEVKLMGGGKLSDDTTYKQYYRLKTDGFRAPQPIRHKGNRIFMAMTAPEQQKTSYNQTFKNRSKGGKKASMVQVQSCKPKEKYNPSQDKLKYKTEYAGSFVPRQVPEKKTFACLSPEELKNYVMTILND